MEVKFLEEDKNFLRVEIKGEDHTLANYLRKELWQDSDVKVAGYNIEHPLASSPILVIETKKSDPKKALQGAVERLAKKNSELIKEVKSI